MIAFGGSKWATGAVLKPEAAILNRAYLNWAPLTKSVPVSAGAWPVLLFSTQQCHDETGTWRDDSETERKLFLSGSSGG